ncbi:MAG: transglycosylase SLT domain-containing protein [Candidatus Pacebacteria bacterium]|nr:transglycosylase SLT domain-containing protein [Candidatus Paceibacterota bacterium]
MDDFDKEFYGTSEPPVGPGAASEPSRSPTVDEFDRDFYGITPPKPPAGKPADVVAPPGGTQPPAPPARVPTRYQQARTPPKVPQPDLTIGEASQRALRNLPSSAAGVIRSTASAFLNPIQTFEGLKEIGRGALSKAKGTIGIEQTAEEKRRDEAVLDAEINRYKQTYGSEQGFLRAFAEDPASIAMDFSAFLTGGAGALGKAGLVSEKAATTAARAASYLDPVQLSVKTAKAISSPVPKALALTAAITTGKSYENIKRAAQVAMDGTEAQKNAFLRQSSDGADQREILDAAEDALKKARDKRSSEYLSQMAQARTTLPQFDYNSTLNLLTNLDNANSTTLSSGQKIPNRKNTAMAIQEMANEVLTRASEPIGSAARSLDGADGLKRRLGEIQAAYRGDPDAYRVATEVYNSILGDIKNKSPDYAKAMQAYEDASELINDARMTMGVGNRRLPDETILRRLLNQKTPQKTQIVEELAEFNPQLPFMIAGAELRDLLPGGPQQLLGGSLAALQYSLVHPLAPIAQAVASSPKVVGKAAYATGKVGAAGRAATGQKVTIPAYYAGRAGEEVAGGIPPPPPEKPEFEEYLGPVVEGADTFSKMLGVESGNRQFNERGETIFGPEVKTEFGPNRAVGKAQVMPYTGPEAAAAAGLEWDENRLRTDEKYNEALGRAYFQKQLQDFGDERLAAAAYNAGPGRVREALRKAQEQGGSFEEFLPAETQDYLRKVFGSASGGRIERRSGGRVDNVETLVSQLMTRVKSAKQETQKMTEPLLNQPDEHIVKALDVAQQAI